MIHGPNIPSSYALLLITASDFTSITSHIHNWVLWLWPHLFILSGASSPFFSTSILDTSQPVGEGGSSFSVLSFCLFILFMGFLSKNTEVVFHFLLQWATFCQNSPPYPISLGCPYTGMAHSFIELYKAVVHVINLISFLVPNWERSTSRLYIVILLI